MPRKKFGRLNPVTETVMMARSIAVPRLTAAMMPSGNPAITMNANDVSVSLSVAGMRSETISRAGLPSRKAFPKSPWNRLTQYSRYWIPRGRSSPHCLRNSSRIAGSVSSGIMADTGSPVSLSTKKTKVTTRNSVKRVRSTLRITNPVIEWPPADDHPLLRHPASMPATAWCRRVAEPRTWPLFRPARRAGPSA